MSANRIQPTARQRLVLATIAAYRQQHGYPPSRTDLANILHCRPNAVQGDLRRLRAKGLVSWEAGKARTVVVTV
jgi:SOS-response transcriptional repressor LexA